MEKKRLLEIIDELKSTVSDAGFHISSNVIFEQACSFMRGEEQNANWVKNNSFKHSHYTSKSNEKSEPSTPPLARQGVEGKGSNEPSPNQLKYLEKHNLEIKSGLTRSEASKILGEHKKKVGGW